MPSISWLSTIQRAYCTRETGIVSTCVFGDFGGAFTRRWRTILSQVLFQFGDEFPDFFDWHQVEKHGQDFLFIL